MAKTATKKTTTAPARSSGKPGNGNKPAQRSNVPAVRGASTEVADNDLLKMMSAEAGRGVSTAMEDNVVPLVYILQALSPQVIRGNQKQVKNAKPGDIWLRGTTITFDGEEGILIQPCHFSKCWIEWMPNRGGFVARHNERPAEAVLTDHPDPQKEGQKVWLMPSGNIVAESREHVVFIHDDKLPRPQPFVIAMAGSQHTASRNWMGLMNNNVIPGTDKIAPSYGFLYRARIVARQKDDYNWFGWEITHGDETSEGTAPLMVSSAEHYKMGRKMFEDINSGALRADVGEADDLDTGEQTTDSEHI